MTTDSNDNRPWWFLPEGELGRLSALFITKRMAVAKLDVNEVKCDVEGGVGSADVEGGVVSVDVVASSVSERGGVLFGGSGGGNAEIFGVGAFSGSSS